MKNLIYIVGLFLYYSNLYKFIMFLRRYNIKILVYHNISDEENPFLDGMNITVRLETFKKHMAFIKRHYHVTDLSTLINLMEEKKRGKYLTAITFDDGYVSFIKNAYPVLRGHEFPSTMFLIGKCILDSGYMWRNKISYIMRNYGNTDNKTDQGIVENTVIQEDKSFSGYSTLDNRGKFADLDNLYRPEEIENCLRDIDEKVCVPKTDLYLTFEDCKRMSGHGVTFGNHSYSHYNFSHLTDEYIKREMLPSNRKSLDEIDYNHSWLALPFGRPLANQSKVEEIARESNLKCIFFSNGLDNKIDNALYRIGRHHLTSEQEYRIFTEMELLPFFRRLRGKFRKVYSFFR